MNDVIPYHHTIPMNDVIPFFYFVFYNILSVLFCTFYSSIVVIPVSLLSVLLIGLDNVFFSPLKKFVLRM